MDDDIIKAELQFYSFTDFFEKKDIIREEYNNLSLRDKKIYKMYVYSTCFESEHVRDLMWNYLNSIELCNNMEIYKEYGIRMRKRKRNGYNKNSINNNNNSSDSE